MRQLKGLSLPQLADAAKISKGYLWQLENGEDPNPSLAILLQVAGALDTTVAELLAQPKSKARTAHIPDSLPAGLKEFLEAQRRRGEPVSDDIARALAQLQARGPRRDWGLLYGVINGIIKSEGTG